MVQTIKFSEFQGPSPVASTDIVVGLRGGENFQFTGVGSGSGTGSVTKIITQIGHGLVVGNYVRINSSGLYVKTLADTSQNAELSGLVIAVADANTFTLQVVGYVAAGVFSGLIAGDVYFLSDIALGAHSLVEPSINGEVSLPVFWAETPTTGWLRQSRGIINGGQPPGGGGAPAPNPNVVTITQSAHGFSAGQVLYLQASGLYSLAHANTLATASAVGIVINVIDVNTFVLQTGGYQSGFITGKVGADIYYLDPAVPGNMTLVRPTTVGQYIKQIYIAETATSGYIQETQPIEILEPIENIVVISQTAHGLVVGNIVYVSAVDTYSKAVASALATASAVGIVILVLDANTFALQTSGYQSGLITGKTPAGIYYLDPVTPGAMTLVQPIAVGQYIKQIYIAESANTGYIQETQPIAITAPAGGSGWTVISTSNVAGLANVDIAMTGYSRYMYVLDGILPSTITSICMRISSDGGISFDSGGFDYVTYTYQNASSNTNVMALSSPSSVSNVLADGGMNGFVQVISPSSATKQKAFLIDICFGDFGGGQKRSTNSMGARSNTALINYVRFLQGDSNAFTSGTIKLLGTNA